jgi:prephenate dehydrogenase
MVANILIVGLGLIGGSLGLALRGTPQVKTVNGFDIDSQTIHQALQIGAIDTSVTLTARCDIDLSAATVISPLSDFALEIILLSISFPPERLKK